MNMLDTISATHRVLHSPATIGHNVLLVSRDSDLAAALLGHLEAAFGCHVRLTPSLPLGCFEAELEGADTLFLDLREAWSGEFEDTLAELHRSPLSAIPVIGIRQRDSRRELSAAMRRTIHGYLDTPVDAAQIGELLGNQLPTALFKTDIAAPRAMTIRTENFEYQTFCPQFHETLKNLSTVAPHDVTILLVGETGTGKTTLARMVHEASRRLGEPLLTVACGALPPDLIESELFGHMKGAFTGADRNKIGKFEAAGRGSILLDEIDVLGPAQQAKLLRVIETGEYEPVGTHETQQSEARIIVATNVDLGTLMARNEFRSDLYYRLNVLEFHIPPLRHRPLDIIPLTLRFIQEFAATHHVAVRRIHPEFLASLKRYPWPGNVRELKNHVRRAVLFCKDGELTPDDLATAILNPSLHRSLEHSAAKLPETLSERVACSEQEILAEALRAHNFKRTATADFLGISRVGLYKKMKKYGMLDLRG